MTSYNIDNLSSKEKTSWNIALVVTGIIIFFIYFCWDFMAKNNTDLSSTTNLNT
jgi:hypothetical protein